MQPLRGVLGVEDPNFAARALQSLPALRRRLAADRHEIVGPALNGVLQLFDALDRVEIGETPPTNAFDARWRDLP